MLPKNIKLEQTELNVGIVALTDCAPLVMAKHLGYFDQWGLDVNLHIQHSWATVRDRLHAGLLDAAQMLAPMPLASTLGLNGSKCEVITAFNLSMNGNGITISTALLNKIAALNNGVIPELPLNSNWLAKFIAEEKKQGKKLKFAAVYPFSCHYYQLRDWLFEADIDADNDVDIIIIPPTNMTDALENNDIDGFCVGTPWNAKAVRAGTGATVITSCDIWDEAPEKVLAVTSKWQQQNPNTFLALLAATRQACEWLKSSANRFETAIVLQDYLNESIEVIAPSLIGSCLTSQKTPARDIPAYNRFISNDANMPKKLQGMTILKKMQQAGQLDSSYTNEDLNKVLNKVYRQDIYTQMTQLGDIA
ncbi:MAG: ABC transporter substrate-binding protein [Gammaproteobacteria bacterium]|nr:ABC transporter substrate-binding protein [Gammaproteobacteria bacterium]